MITWIKSHMYNNTEAAEDYNSHDASLLHHHTRCYLTVMFHSAPCRLNVVFAALQLGGSGFAPETRVTMLPTPTQQTRARADPRPASAPWSTGEPDLKRPHTHASKNIYVYVCLKIYICMFKNIYLWFNYWENNHHHVFRVFKMVLHLSRKGASLIIKK